MRMFKGGFACIVFSALAMLSQAQTLCTSRNGSMCYSVASGLVTSNSVATEGTWPAISGNGTIVWSGGGGGFAETRKPIIPMPTLVGVKASARKIKSSDIASTAYLKLAASIGLDSAATDESKLLSAIAGHGYSVYNYAAVDNYLYNQALSMKVTNMRWVWKPMREADAKAIPASGAAWSVTGQNQMGLVDPSMYAKAIPERILEDVRCLLAERPDLIALISDFEVVKPDPFLAVTTPRLLAEHKIFIIDFWNEPGFTEADQKTAPSPTPVKHDDGKQSIIAKRD